MTDQRGKYLERVIVVGGAGFIGSHFTDRLLERHETKAVTIYDNFPRVVSGTWSSSMQPTIASTW